jgi:hypothetical protein
MSAQLMLFCDWQAASVTHATAQQQMMVRGLIEHDRAATPMVSDRA